MSETQAARRPSKRALKTLVNGLEQVKDNFVWEGFADSNDAVVEQGVLFDQGAADVDVEPDSEPGDDDENGEEFEEEYYATSFDREDVEVAIDELISELIRKRLITKAKSGRLPSLSRVVATFFGDEHPIVTVASRFEEHIKGYFGSIDYDDMRAAYNDILELQELVSKEEAAGV